MDIFDGPFVPWRESELELRDNDDNAAAGGTAGLESCACGLPDAGPPGWDSTSNKCAGAVGFGLSAGISSLLLSALRSPTWRKNKPGVNICEVARKISFEDAWATS